MLTLCAPGRRDLRPPAGAQRPVLAPSAKTHERLSPLFDDAARRALDALCVTDIALGVSRLVGREATSASPVQIVAQLATLAFLRELGATSWDLDVVAANRRRQLAALARRSTTAALAGRPDRLRYPALLCFCGEQAVRLVDDVLDRADQAVCEAHGQALRAQGTEVQGTAVLLVALVGVVVNLVATSDSTPGHRARPIRAGTFQGGPDLPRCPHASSEVL